MVQTIHGDPFVDQILMGNSEPLLIGMVALIHLSNRVSVATEISAPSSQRDMKAKVKRIPRLERMFLAELATSALCCDLTPLGSPLSAACVCFRSLLQISR